MASFCSFFFVLLCAFIIQWTTNANPNHFHHFNITTLMELEGLGELYYADQKDERYYRIAEDFQRLKPNFPCVLGVTPLGNAGKASIDDGHKFACGLHAISEKPIIYSFGSNQQQDFEQAVLRYRPDAQIFVFELIASHLPAESLRDSRISYNAIGLGGYEKDEKIESGWVLKTLRTLMIERNHSYIDVLKMDIEGMEYMWLKYEAPQLVPRIGQFLVEVHVHFGFVQQKFPKQDAFTFVVELEKYGFRLFHQELNKHQTLRFTELALIHHNWTRWEAAKHELTPLTVLPA